MLADKLKYKVRVNLSCDFCKACSPSIETRRSVITSCENKSLSELASGSFAIEEIPDGVCSSCKHTGIIKKSDMLVFPSVLAVHIKRFKYDNGQVVKIYAGIKDPLEQVQISGRCYEVSAVVCHEGHPTSGHYIALVRDKTNKDLWWHCNDAIVTAAQTAEACLKAKEGYLFFLQLV